jgi:hypothetical protein
VKTGFPTRNPANWRQGTLLGGRWELPIRWEEIPHDKIRLEIYARLEKNAVGRSADDSTHHMLRRRLSLLGVEDHRRFIELEARDIVAHLRCIRDVYREFVNAHDCRPIIEAHWAVLRCAVFPNAIAVLREKVIDYLRLTRVPGRDLTLLFGIATRSCSDEGAILRSGKFDLADKRIATDVELQMLARTVNEHTLLSFRDIRDGGAVVKLLGGGPFALDDFSAIERSWGLCALHRGITLPDWIPIREAQWHQLTPWTDGLFNLFGCVQEEMLSQWRALPPDSVVYKSALKDDATDFAEIMVPAEALLPQYLIRGKECEELAKEIRTIRHKRLRDGLTVAEIQTECSTFKIWSRVEVLSSEDKDTFMHPSTWDTGYENLLLGKLYAETRRAVAAATINTWRKEYRAYVRWKRDNPAKPAGDFLLELQARKRGYRKGLKQISNRRR